MPKLKEKKCVCGNKIISRLGYKLYCSQFCAEVDSRCYTGDPYKETIERLKKKGSVIFKKYGYPQN